MLFFAQLIDKQDGDATIGWEGFERECKAWIRCVKKMDATLWKGGA